MSAHAAALPGLGAPRAGLRRVLRAADRGSGVVCGIALIALAGLLLATAAGYRPLIDHSDSMRPAIRAGDLLITHAAPATSIRRNARRLCPRASGSISGFSRCDRVFIVLVLLTWRLSRSGV